MGGGQAARLSVRVALRLHQWVRANSRLRALAHAPQPLKVFENSGCGGVHSTL